MVIGGLTIKALKLNKVAQKTFLYSSNQVLTMIESFQRLRLRLRDSTQALFILLFTSNGVQRMLIKATKES